MFNVNWREIDYKKYIKPVLYGILVISVMIGLQLFITVFYRDEGKMIEAFTDSEANFKKSQITVVGNLGEKYFTKEDKENLIEFLGNEIGLNTDYNIHTVKGDKTETVSVFKQGNNANTEIEMISVEETKANKNIVNQYVYVNLTLYEDKSKILSYRNLVQDAMKKLDIGTVNSTIKIEGTYDGKLSYLDKNKITDEIIDELQLKIVNDHRGEDLYTVYGYSSLIKDYITVEKNRVNVNLVFQYDEEKNQTVLYLATPIMNEDY